MSKISNWYEDLIKEMGYNGCRNCKYQIEPLRTCEWLERGGDGKLHLICPRWEKEKMLKKLINYIRHRRFCHLNRYYCPDCIYHDFIFDGVIFRGNRCRLESRK